MDFFVTLNQILVLFIMLVVGFMIRKLKIVEESFTRNLSNLLFNVVLPAMIINGMNFPFSTEVLKDGAILIGICLAILLFSALLSIIVIKSLNVDPHSRNVFQFAMLFSNFGFMGYPVVEALFGKEGILYASLFNIPIFILFNSLGIMFFKRGEKNGLGMDLKNAVSPPMISVIVGLCVFLFSIKLPMPIGTSIAMIGSTITPLSMFLTGILLANASISKMFSNYKVYIISFFRLVFIPVILLLILKMFDLSLLMIGIPVVITAMPVAANAAILAEKFDGNAYLGAQSVFISTLLSVLTIPLIAFFL